MQSDPFQSLDGLVVPAGKVTDDDNESVMFGQTLNFFENMVELFWVRLNNR